jgi:hypothetical protein
MRLILLISLFIAAVQADPITVVETQSGVGIPSFLSYSYSVPTTPAPVTANILAEAGSNNCVNCSDQPLTAGIDLTMDLYTAGPIREGVGLVELGITSCCAYAGSAHVSGAIGPYSLSSCPIELDCVLNGYFPFELGVPFTIHLSGLGIGAGFDDSASLQLYEVPPGGIGQVGAPVQILVAPEPNSAGFTVTGLSALVLLGIIRRRKLQRLWLPVD